MLSGYWQGKQKWTLANVVRNDDAAGRNIGKTFEFVFPEFAAEQAESQRFWFGGAEWYFTTDKYSNDDSLGVYLSLAQDHAGFSVKLKSYKFVVVDQEDEQFNIEKSSVPKVFTYSQGWGFHKFVKLSELKRGDRSFLRTNRLVFRLEMTHATAMYDHLVDMNALKTGSVGKFSYDSVDWMVRVIDTDSNVSAAVIKTVTVPGTHFTGELKISLVNEVDLKLTVKKKLGLRLWTTNKTQHGDSLLKTADVKAQKGFVRNANPVPASPGSASAAAALPPTPQILVRFEMKHMTTLLDVPIPNLSAALAGSSLAFTYQTYTWNLTCKKEANQVALHLHLQNPAEHKTYHTAFALTIVSGKADDETNNITKSFGVATFYKYTTQLGFNQFATLEDLTRIKAVNNSALLVRVSFDKMDIATTYLDATVAKGGAAAVKLAKDEIEKFRKYYYTTRTELKAVREQLDAASNAAHSLQSKQGKFQLELEPLQMALQAKTEAAETLLTDLEAERTKSSNLKRDLDKSRESLGFMSMLWLESVRHVAKEVVTTEDETAAASSSAASETALSTEHTAMVTLDILTTLRHIVEESSTISSKQLRKEYKKKTGVSLRETLRREKLGTPLAFLEANMSVFSFEEPTISLKPSKQVSINISQADVTAMAVKAVPTPESASFLTDAFEFVNKFLPQVLPLPIINIFLAGAAGKAVALSGSTNIDVVVFIDKVPETAHGSWLPPILMQLQRVIKVKLPTATEVEVRDQCVHFAFEGATINLFPTSQWHSTDNAIYETMIKHPHGWYDAATAPKQVEFVKTQPEAVKSIIRIVQTWNRASPSPVPEYLVELISIYACTPKTAGAVFEPLSALSRVFEIIADFDNQRIFWEKYYKINLVPSAVFTEQPLVLDPTNPTNNLARNVDVSAFKQRAKEVLDSGLSNLLSHFRS